MVAVPLNMFSVLAHPPTPPSYFILFDAVTQVAGTDLGLILLFLSVKYATKLGTPFLSLSLP